MLRKSLLETGFEALRGKELELVYMVEMLCEICGEPLNVKERSRKRIRVSGRGDFEKLLRKVTAHDRAEIDVEEGKIWFYDHDFPGDMHPDCLEKL